MKKFRVETPENFIDKNHPLKNSLYTNGRGLFSTTYDISENKLKGGTNWYIDAINGSDENDGLTKDTAMQSFDKLMAKVNDNDTVYIAKGNYLRKKGMVIPRPLEKSVNLIGENNEVNLIMSDKPIWKKTSEKNNVYELVRTNTDTVFDLNNKNSLEKVNDLDEVDKLLNSWYTDGTKVYINVGDSDISNVFPLITSYNFQASDLNSDIYFENLNFIGGKHCVELNLNTDNNAYFKNCTFRNSSNTFNGLTVNGGNNIVLNNCLAINNSYDGFNYHIGKDGSKPTIVEIDCVGYANGRDKGKNGVQSNNGSTIHEGLKAIRLNGTYAKNDGGNVADVNQGTQSWNLGCAAFESYQGKDFQTSSGATMFLDNCIAYGSENSINVVDDTATTYIRMGEYQNKLITGKEVKY